MRCSPSVLGYRGWSYTEFAKRCRIVAVGLGHTAVYEGAADKIRNRLASIMTCCMDSKHDDSGPINWGRAAKHVYDDEIEVYAQTLGIHASWLKSAASNKGGIELTNSELSIENIITMTAIYEEMTADMTVVSRIIPGELLPEELMHSYLTAIDESTEYFSSRSDLHRFSTFANDRRMRLQNPSKTASSDFVLPFEQIEDALTGKGAFAKIDAPLRDEVATYLAEIVANPLRKTRIAFAKKEQFDIVLGKADFVTLSCGDMYTLQFSGNGNIKYWSGRSEKTVQNSRLLADVIAASS